MAILKSILNFIKKIRVDLIIILGCVAIFAPVIYFNQPSCVGDGSEYYAMAVAWRSTHKPFMTEMSWLQYDRLVETKTIDGIIDVPHLQNMFPGLAIGSTNDFAHFWFYSLGAAVVSKFGDLFALNLPIHTSFLFFHCLLLMCLSIVAWRCYGWKGLIAVGVLTFLSPMLWFLDKVHTEFFTFCLTTCAVMLFLKRRYLLSALFLAITATQNLSFAGISVFVIAVYLYLKREDLKFSLAEGLQIMIIFGILALPAVYYFSRYGAFSVQFLTGAANIGVRGQYFYVWFLDPDIGLFPNWPFGLGLIVLALIALKTWKVEKSRLIILAAFYAVYIVVSLAAQVSTVNINSGGTLGVARYALWYIALFFPMVVLIIRAFRWNKIFTAAAVAWLLLGALISVKSYQPTVSKFAYFSPTPASRWIQTNLPGLYNPPTEIFAERFGGLGESSVLWNSLAVIGPDCHKVLLINLSPDSDIVLGQTSCGLNFGTLANIIRQNLQDGTWNGINGLSYVYLSDTELKESKLVSQLDQWLDTSSAGDFGKSIFTSSNGWGLPEIWGTWTNGNNAKISVPCPTTQGQINQPGVLELDMVPFVTPAHPQVTGKVLVDNQTGWAGTLENAAVITIELSPTTCMEKDTVSIEFQVENPVSPASLGLSTDGRALGFGLRKIRFSVSKQN